VPTARGVKIGAATSVRKAEWEAARSSRRMDTKSTW
jgi:hypothetical protein